MVVGFSFGRDTVPSIVPENEMICTMALPFASTWAELLWKSRQGILRPQGHFVHSPPPSFYLVDRVLRRVRELRPLLLLRRRKKGQIYLYRRNFTGVF